MKKFILALVTCLLAFSFIACNNNTPRPKERLYVLEHLRGTYDMAFKDTPDVKVGELVATEHNIVFTIGESTTDLQYLYDNWQGYKTCSKDSNADSCGIDLDSPELLQNYDLGDYNTDEGVYIYFKVKTYNRVVENPRANIQEFVLTNKR